MSTSVASPLRWHGGKSYLASKIVTMMPPHLHYVEPYAGGLSVLLAKDPEGVSEVVNDLNGELTNFWSVLRSACDFQVFRYLCFLTPFCEKTWQECEQMIDDLQPRKELRIERAWAFFVTCRQSLAGRMDTFSPITRNRTRRGMNEQVSAWLSAVEGLPEVHARLQRVLILNHDALDVIRQQDGPQTLFYLDPPYLHETRATTGEYQHEMTAEQHEKLLLCLTKLKGRFMLSGYRSELYDQYAELDGWHRVDFDLPNNSAGGRKKRRVTECVWMNFEPKGQ